MFAQLARIRSRTLPGRSGAYDSAGGFADWLGNCGEPAYGGWNFRDGPSGLPYRAR